MVRALKAPDVKSKLPKKLPKPSIPKLPDPNEPDEFEEMTLLEHMIELRDRIVKAGIAVIIAFAAGVYFARPFLELLKREANIETGFDVVAPTDTITLYFKVALYIAIAIALPVIVWQVFGFLAPGLTKKEKRILFSSLPFVVVLFIGGAAYGFFIAAPAALTFLSNFLADLYEWSPEGGQVISFYLTLMIGLALAFQLPVIMFLLAKLNIATPQKMRSFWKYALLIVFIVSAVITPSTDPFNMMLVAIPLYTLYWAGIIFAYLFARRGINEPTAGAPA
jgi:sec-independent protein translocase protein TatC